MRVFKIGFRRLHADSIFADRRVRVILENMNDLERTFLATISREELFPRGSSVYAAVSGGADSVAMLRLLERYSRSRGWQIGVLHIDHRTRPESGSDLLFVEEMAAELSLPFTPVILEEETGGSAESRWSAARQAVYARQPGLVAVGHNAGDRAETVLLRLVEGAGLRGLGGMDYAGVGPVRRPMLDLKRDEIRNWLRREGIPWREDGTNADTSVARNRMRLKVLPVLAECFPGSIEGICRSGSILSGWRDLQEMITVMFPSDDMERNEFLALPEVLSCLFLWNASGKPRNGFTEFAKVSRWVRGGGRGEHILPGGRRLVADKACLKVVEKGPGRY